MENTSKFFILLLILMLLTGTYAAADTNQNIQLAGGLTVRLSDEWNTVESNDTRQEDGSFQTVVSMDGENLCEIAFTDAAYTEPEYETEVLDWFKDNVASMFPKGTRFTVKDVATGRTFEAVSFSGRNHMDSEPCTAEDSATIKDIYGGVYSWDFRPILIRFEGHVYAASMNGKPHAKSDMEGNGFDGHFCIHFKNSWLHEEWMVSDKHQVMIQKAAQASW